jgi:hypothetical protein
MDHFFAKLTTDDAIGETRESPGDGGSLSHPSEQARIPLSIVLTNAQAREWREYKEGVSVVGDTTAFLMLLKLAHKERKED